MLCIDHLHLHLHFYGLLTLLALVSPLPLGSGKGESDPVATTPFPADKTKPSLEKAENYNDQQEPKEAAGGSSSVGLLDGMMERIKHFGGARKDVIDGNRQRRRNQDKVAGPVPSMDTSYGKHGKVTRSLERKTHPLIEVVSIPSTQQGKKRSGVEDDSSTSEIGPSSKAIIRDRCKVSPILLQGKSTKGILRNSVSVSPRTSSEVYRAGRTMKNFKEIAESQRGLCFLAFANLIMHLSVDAQALSFFDISSEREEKSGSECENCCSSFETSSLSFTIDHG